MDREAIQDFLRRSNSICDQNDCDTASAADEMKIRRMSLKEFTGLDPPREEQLTNLHNPSWKSSVSSSTLLNSYSARRRVEDLRARLTATTSHVESGSPSKKVPPEKERKRLLEDSKTLATSCEKLVRCATQPGPSAPECSSIVNEVYEAARNVATAAKHVAAHCQVFKAQLITTETDLVFSSLVDTLEEVERHLQDPIETDKIIHSSTTLAARLTQLITSAASL